MDELITFGGELKALDDTGRVGGYLVRFSDGKHKDLAGEYFNAKSDLGPSDGNGQECLFEHGFPVIPTKKAVTPEHRKALEMLADRKFQPLKTHRDTIGIFAETVLDLEDEYEQFIHKRIKAGKMGWSSAAASHRVKRADDGWLMRWPISEGSITPRPCEPKNIGGVMTLKALADIELMDMDDGEEQPPAKPFTGKFGERIGQLIADREEDGQQRETVVKSLASAAMIRPDQVELIIMENQRPSNAVIKAFARVLTIEYDLLRDLADRGTPKTIKGLFEEELAERKPSTWELDSAMRCVIRKIAEAATASAEGGGEYDWKPKVAETMAEYTTRMTELVNTQVASWVAGEWDGDEFYLKGIVPEDLLVSSNGLGLEDHSNLVVSAAMEFSKRCEANADIRIKAGRVLSDKTRKMIQSAINALQNLLDSTNPMPSDTEKNAAWIHHQRVKHEMQRAQIGV